MSSAFCHDCDHVLDDVPLGSPCPACGGDRRSAVATAQAAMAVGASLDAGVSVLNGPRRWSRRWWSVRRLHDKLARIYAGEGFEGNLDWEDTVRYFLLDCFSLTEWVAKDPDVPRNAASAAMSLGSKSFLSLARDFAHTDKHRDRDKPDTQRLVFIRSTSGSPDGHRLELVAFRAGQQLETFDALDVADGCLKQWRAFFGTHHLAEPA